MPNLLLEGGRPRVAATQAKLAATAVEEKEARVIADVQTAIAERKRKRAEDFSQTQGAEPSAQQRREDGAAMTSTHAQVDITEQKRRREQEGEPKEKQGKDEMRQAEDKNTALQAAQEQDGTKASSEASLLANRSKATQRDSISNVSVLLALSQ